MHKSFWLRLFKKEGLLVLLCAAAPMPVQIQAAWSRATAPHQDSGVVYLNLSSSTGDTLTGVSSPDAQAAMLHATTSTGTMSSMSDMESLALPPGQPVRLAPHGTHIMLMGLKHPLVAGGTVRLDLTFAKAGQAHVDVPIRPIGSAP